MSRSYKKNIRVTDGRAHTTKYVKNLANRKARPFASSTTCPLSLNYNSKTHWRHNKKSKMTLLTI